MSAVWPLSATDAIERIRQRNPEIRAYVSTRLDDALHEAEQFAGRPSRSPLDGVPYGLKDEWDTAGIATTGGSYRHRQRVPKTSSTVFSAFDSAGAILVGKTNLSDMGLAPEAANFLVGATRNPHDPRRTAGGSSGGAAAAIADGMQAFDWGTDIGGSIRLPAAFCGILGMRLSSKVWPMEGAFPMPPASLRWMCGQGPMTRTIEQMRRVLDVAAPVLRKGPPRPFAVRGALIYAPHRLGHWPSFDADVTPEIRAILGDRPIVRTGLPSTGLARHVFGELWASHLEDLLEADPSLSFAEGLAATISSVLCRGRFGDRRLHPATAELIALMAIGRYTVCRNRSVPIERAESIREQFETQWAKGNLIVAPVSVHRTPLVGRSNWHPDLISCTVPGNLADATALSIPFGTFDDGMPRAIQLMGPPGSEGALLEFAERFLAPREATASSVFAAGV